MVQAKKLGLIKAIDIFTFDVCNHPDFFILDNKIMWNCWSRLVGEWKWLEISLEFIVFHMPSHDFCRIWTILPLNCIRKIVYSISSSFGSGSFSYWCDVRKQCIQINIIGTCSLWPSKFRCSSQEENRLSSKMDTNMLPISPIHEIQWKSSII